MNDKNQEKIAYEGAFFTIEWYFDERGYSEAKEYYFNLSIDRRQKVQSLFKVMADLGKVYNKTKFRHEGDQIYAFKPKPDRFLCFFYIGKKIIITNAFEKKTNKLPSQEKHKAIRYKQDYETRTINGEYYGNE